MNSNKKRPPASDPDDNNNNWEANSSAKTRKVPRRKIPSSPTPPTTAPNYIPTTRTTITSTNTTTDITTGVAPVLQEGTTNSTPALETRTFLSSQHHELSIAVPIDSPHPDSIRKDEEELTAADAVAAVAAAAGLSNAGEHEHYTSSEHLGQYIPQAEHDLGHHGHQQYEHHEDDQREFDPSIIAVNVLRQQLQQHHMQHIQQDENLSSVGGENQGHHHNHEHLDQGHNVSDNHHHRHQLQDRANVSDSGDSSMSRSARSQGADDHGGIHSGDGGSRSDGGQYKRTTRGRGPSHALRNLSSDERRDRRLQRNRVAAKECRNKKKAYIMTLEEKCAGLEEENMRLLKQVDELNAKFTLGTMRQLVNSSGNGSILFNNQPGSNIDAAAADTHNSAASDKNLTRPAGTFVSVSKLSDMAHAAAAAVAQAAGLDIRSLGAQLAAVASAGASSVPGSTQPASLSTVPGEEDSNRIDIEVAEPVRDRPSTPR